MSLPRNLPNRCHNRPPVGWALPTTSPSRLSRPPWEPQSPLTRTNPTRSIEFWIILSSFSPTPPPPTIIEYYRGPLDPLPHPHCPRPQPPPRLRARRRRRL